MKMRPAGDELSDADSPGTDMT